MKIGAGPVTSAAIIAALGYTPASAGAVVMADGSAASPGMFFGSTTNLGFYLGGPNVLGVAVQGLQHTRFYVRDIIATKDNSTLEIGRAQSFSAGSGAYAYPWTLTSPKYTISNNTPIVVHDIGLSQVEVSDTTTQTVVSYTVEIDKTDITATGGAVSFSGGFGGMVVRIPIAKTNVTLANAYGIDFTIPDAASVTGTHTNTKLIRFPSPDLGAASTYYGLWFEDEYNGAHIASAQAHDLTIVSGRYAYLTAAPSGSNGIVQIDGQGSGGRVYLMQNNRLCLEVGTVGASLNYVQVSANNTPLIMAQHASTANLSLSLSSKGTSSLLLGTNGGTTQLTVSDTPSAVNTVQITGAASGANPRIGVTAENLIIGTGASRATTATSGYIIQSASSGAPTGVPTGVSTAGRIVIAADYTNKKLYIYNGATTSWESGWTIN